MEALERFFSTPGENVSWTELHRKLTGLSEISNPKLVVIVGSFGLASNIFGLFLFHGVLCLYPAQMS